MKRTYTIHLLSVALFMVLFHVQAFAQAGASLELVSLNATQDSVCFAAHMTNTSGANFVLEAVFVTITYDPSKVTNDSARCIKNHRFASAGFDSYSNAKLHTFISGNEDTAQYGEASAAIGTGVSFPPNYGVDLCTFTFFPISHPDCANFTLVGNIAAPAYTGFYITSQATSIPFYPATDLPNHCWTPVEFLSFTAMQQGDAISLRWVTGSETNNYGFTVERRFVEYGDTEWHDMTFIQGHGNSNVDITYLHYDYKLSGPGTYEYRLRQQDFDGKIKYSPIRRVEYSLGALSFGLEPAYPNPVSTNAASGTIFRFALTEPSQVRLVVMNTLGQVVGEVINNSYPAGTFAQSWFPKNVPPGTYIGMLTAQGMETGKINTANVRLQVTN